MICDHRDTTPSCKEDRWKTARRSRRTSTSGSHSSRSTRRVICLVSLFLPSVPLAFVVVLPNFFFSIVLFFSSSPTIVFLSRLLFRRLLLEGAIACQLLQGLLPRASVFTSFSSSAMCSTIQKSASYTNATPPSSLDSLGQGIRRTQGSRYSALDRRAQNRRTGCTSQKRRDQEFRRLESSYQNVVG